MGMVISHTFHDILPMCILCRNAWFPTYNLNIMKKVLYISEKDKIVITPSDTREPHGYYGIAITESRKALV